MRPIPKMTHLQRHQRRREIQKRFQEGATVPQLAASFSMGRSTIQLYVRGANGQRIYTSFRELVEGTMGTSLTRTDLHLSRSADGEIFLTSRQDGMIRMLVPDSGRDR